jgi:hypothetical protein
MGWKNRVEHNEYMRRRYESGLCAECSAPREQKRTRCSLHLRLASEAAKKRYAANVPKYRKIARESQTRRRKDPATRAQINALNRTRYIGNRDLFLRHELKSRYGISLEEYREMERKQQGCCALCGKPPLVGKRAAGKEKQPPRLCVDHDHRTKEVRGLLCHWCNSHIVAGIEKAGVTLAQIAAYLGGGVQSRSI